jgi:hypothetical protein
MMQKKITVNGGMADSRQNRGQKKNANQMKGLINNKFGNYVNHIWECEN